MRWRNAGMVPQTVFGLEYYIFVPVIPWGFLVIHGWWWTVLLLLWFAFMILLNKKYGLRLMDVLTLVHRFIQGDWRVR
ncbi:hypothetical protein ACJU26_05940 [Acidithiobacillus sp. M4-SHS-6]|uniref:hypothetical protein n=1 Tax=Acidithiobacillus sp. M4-SHS-6 TaxID=3383024 RepID=UPI0039BE4F43